jgi:organic hydroperoxide reductase OsmC/OhrA
MSEHTAKIDWTLGDAEFTYEGYSRAHTWRFVGAVEVPASSAPEYGGTPERVDPEEALVAAVASCHMLTLLAIAAKKRLHLTAYSDSPVGYLEKDAEGRLAVTRIVLRPTLTFAGERPSDEVIMGLHEGAHRNCFIANSIKSEVTVEAP